MKKEIFIFVFVLIFCYLSSLGSTQLVPNTGEKYLGNIYNGVLQVQISGSRSTGEYKKYWNRLTVPKRAKWNALEPTQGTWDPINFNPLMSLLNATLRSTVNIPTKIATIVDPDFDPTWIAGLSTADQQSAVVNWIRYLCNPESIISKANFTDVVNGAVTKTPIYAAAFGGAGSTGWDWVIQIFRRVKAICPSTMKRHINQQLNNPIVQTPKYIQIIKLLQRQNLVDGVGVQCRGLQKPTANMAQLIRSLYQIKQATGMPVHVTQLLLPSSDDIEQRNLYTRIFPQLFEHPAVTGITIWGFMIDTIQSVPSEGLKYANNMTQRLALAWLRTVYFNSSLNKPPKAYWTNTSSNLKISFFSGSFDVDGTITSYLWDFGDGTTSTDQNPIHTFPTFGSYTVSLTVTDNGNQQDTFSDVLVVTLNTGNWDVPISYCKPKFVGSTIKNNYISPNWNRYWNQATPQILGRWAYVQSIKDTMNWASLDFAWNYARSQGAVFTGHTLISATQIPSWVAGLTPSEQALQVEEWIKLYCKKYSDYQLLNVVNEPLHGAPNYADAIGGAGTTGWDWVIWAYQKARLYCPNAKLIISDYDILTNDANTQSYIQLINLLKARNLIDGIGEQGHKLQNALIYQISNNLNALATIERPIYITELDLDFFDDAQQLAKMKQLFPLFYENSWVRGVTFWGYIRGQTTASGAWLYDAAASGSTSIGLVNERPSLKWLKYEYMPEVANITNPKALYKYTAFPTEQLLVSFDASLSHDCDGQIVSYSWDFNGASTGSGSRIDYPFPTPGYYVVTLTIVDNNNNRDTFSQNITVGTINEPPEASFVVTSVNGLTVNVDASASKDPDGTIQNYSWNWGYVTTDGSGVTATNSYLQTGQYTITLTVTDNKGATSTATATVNLIKLNAPPTAQFTWLANNLTVTFSSTSSDSDGNIDSYSWNLGNGITNTNSQFTYTFPASGDYPVTLTVTDNNRISASVSDTIRVVRQNLPPVARFDMTSVNTSTVLVNAADSSDDTGIQSYSWNWGNGAVSSGITSNYTYGVGGNYTVTLTVTDLDGLGNSLSKVIEIPIIVVKPLECKINACNLKKLQATCNSNSIHNRGIVNIVNYVWRWGDGFMNSGSNMRKAQHTYLAGNTYNVVLTITDVAGATASCNRTIIVPKN